MTPNTALVAGSAAWVKHKLRREEQLAVIGDRLAYDGWLEAVFVARPCPDGSFAARGRLSWGFAVS